ncbi:hypothetical protein A6D98_09760 [Aliivibrio fischeri]|uniref:hypothetical protein n=1 Tax=Aliivibrio fischeri TaxID=668 RepID=UPI00080DBA9F|nr:hypothetical protein [Aliivibrio fischeri]OCH60876.1 hypothetical protein A6D98_09760 [Aliivibrio fischeri]
MRISHKRKIQAKIAGVIPRLKIRNEYWDKSLYNFSNMKPGEKVVLFCSTTRMGKTSPLPLPSVDDVMNAINKPTQEKLFTITEPTTLTKATNTASLSSSLEQLGKVILRGTGIEVIVERICKAFSGNCDGSQNKECKSASGHITEKCDVKQG